MFHDVPIPLTDLNRYLFPDREPIRSETPQVVVVCEFNNAQQGFLIDAVDRIFRCNWDQIQAPTSIIAESDAMVRGIVHSEGHDVLLIDFEAIISDISGGSTLHATEDGGEISAEERAQRSLLKVLLADDSQLVREQTEHPMRQAGFSDLTICDDGAEAYRTIQSNLEHPFDVVISDIEMPQLDGLTLCRRLKETKSPTKVIILSSMISEQVSGKCRQVGADAFLSKGQMRDLPHISRRTGRHLSHLNLAKRA